MGVLHSRPAEKQVLAPHLLRTIFCSSQPRELRKRRDTAAPQAATPREPPAFHRRHAQPDRLRTCLRSTTQQHRVRQRSRGGLNHNGGGFAAADLPAERRAGYGAAPPASRVATAIAARRACGPPLTPEPLQPLTAQCQGQGQSPCPPDCTALTTKPNTTKSLRFQGIATGSTAAARIGETRGPPIGGLNGLTLRSKSGQSLKIHCSRWDPEVSARAPSTSGRWGDLGHWRAECRLSLPVVCGRTSAEEHV